MFYIGYGCIYALFFMSADILHFHFLAQFRRQNQSSFSSLSVIVYVNLFLAISSLSRYSS